MNKFRIAALSASLALVPAAALAIPAGNYTMDGNYIITGGLVVDGLASGFCASSQVGGSPCSGGGGGAVSSVTSTNSNLSAAPTTGAVVLDFSNSPIFTGLTTTDTLQVNSTSQFNGAMGVTGSISAGGLSDSSIAPGECVETTGGSILVGTGSPCGSGGVSSVTAGPSGNLTFSPTTGAVVGDIISAPTFTNITTTNGTATSGFMVGIAGAYEPNFSLSNGFGGGNGTSNFVTTNARASSGVTGNCFEIDLGGVGNVIDANCVGDFGAVGYLAAVGHGVPFDQSSTGSRTTHYEHGSQTITSVGGTCVAGSAITFGTAFSSAPTVVVSTTAVVGNTGASGSVTTTGFTPSLCSTTSSAANPINWMAVGI